MSNLIKMFELQDAFNKKVHPEWRTQNFAFDEAIIVESAELFEHLGYKWWKSNEIDINQAVMELVDIWHFGMSHMITSDIEAPFSKFVEQIGSQDYFILQNQRIEHLDINHIKHCVKTMIHSISDSNYSFFDIESFMSAWFNFGLDYDDLYKKYVGKNALNEFRQNNGYKSGTYIKVWDGREDNEFLTDILQSVSIDENLYTNVIEQLEAIYDSVK
jgi:dimeric dUTPase (all-alpha-NTP-PPase superfamily)